jgi:prefoldin alpha subunit
LSNLSAGLQQKETQLRKVVGEMRQMEGSVNVLQQRFSQVMAAVSELRLAEKSLGDLKETQPDSNLLVPVGGGAFIDAKMGSIENVIVGIGAGVSVEMQYDAAVEDVKGRLTEMEKAKTAVDQQLRQILAQIESHQSMAERLSTEIQGSVQGSI